MLSAVSAPQKKKIFKDETQRNRTSVCAASPTCSSDPERPADDVGVALVQLARARHGGLAVVELMHVPGIHGDRVQLRLTSLLQRDDAVTSLDVDSAHQAADWPVA